MSKRLVIKVDYFPILHNLQKITISVLNEIQWNVCSLCSHHCLMGTARESYIYVPIKQVLLNKWKDFPYYLHVCMHNKVCTTVHDNDVVTRLGHASVSSARIKRVQTAKAEHKTAAVQKARTRATFWSLIFTGIKTAFVWWKYYKSKDWEWKCPLYPMWCSSASLVSITASKQVTH